MSSSNAIWGWQVSPSRLIQLPNRGDHIDPDIVTTIRIIGPGTFSHLGTKWSVEIRTLQERLVLEAQDQIEAENLRDKIAETVNSTRGASRETGASPKDAHVGLIRQVGGKASGSIKENVSG